ncbi:MAG: transcription antitermination factor NusB [Burkholderiales bacterium]|nr:transcription antitermination factor NusB [Anaerolineae bacterium]
MWNDSDGRSSENGVDDLPLPEFNPENYQTEVVRHDVPTTGRSVARRIALQVLYEVDAAKHAVGEIITFHLQSQPVSKKAARYVRRLVLGVVNNREQLDAVIQHYAPDFPLDQVAIVDRNILRMAIFEFGAQGHIPVGVAIDEAVELAKLFGAEGSSRFVNGVLGTVVDDESALHTLLSVKSAAADGEILTDVDAGEDAGDNADEDEYDPSADFGIGLDDFEGGDEELSG